MWKCCSAVWQSINSQCKYYKKYFSLYVHFSPNISQTLAHEVPFVLFFSFCPNLLHVETVLSFTWDWRKALDLDPWTSYQEKKKSISASSICQNEIVLSRFASAAWLVFIEKKNVPLKDFFFFCLHPVCVLLRIIFRKKRFLPGCSPLFDCNGGKKSCLTHEWLRDLQMWFFFLYFYVHVSLRLWLCTCYIKNELHWFKKKKVKN